MDLLELFRFESFSLKMSSPLIKWNSPHNIGVIKDGSDSRRLGNQAKPSVVIPNAGSEASIHRKEVPSSSLIAAVIDIKKGICINGNMTSFKG